MARIQYMKTASIEFAVGFEVDGKEEGEKLFEEALQEVMAVVGRTRGVVGVAGARASEPFILPLDRDREPPAASGAVIADERKEGAA